MMNAPVSRKLDPFHRNEDMGNIGVKDTNMTAAFARTLEFILQVPSERRHMPPMNSVTISEKDIVMVNGFPWVESWELRDALRGWCIKCGLTLEEVDCFQAMVDLNVGPGLEL